MLIATLYVLVVLASPVVAAVAAEMVRRQD
jgi:hypothetical protein